MSIKENLLVFKYVYIALGENKKKWSRTKVTLDYIKHQYHNLIIVIKRRTGPIKQSQSLNLISSYEH